MVLGSFVGFGQLLVGPGYLSDLPDNVQFYYCIGFALIAVMSLIVLTLYLFMTNRVPVSKQSLIRICMFMTALPIPATFGLFFFAGAYVNNVVAPLPLLPVMPVTVIYIAFLAAVTILCLMVVAYYLESNRQAGSNKPSPEPPKVVPRLVKPIPKEEMAECPMCGKLSGLSQSSCPHCGAVFDGKETATVAAGSSGPEPSEDSPKPTVTRSAVDEALAEAEMDGEEGGPSVVREKG